MRVVSFNVNSVRIRLHQLQAVIDKHAPAVIGLQETKVQDAEFPIEDINALGYDVIYYGQKTHYGVAMMYKQEAIQLYHGLPSDDEDSQRRFVAAKFKLEDGKILTVLNGYYPQGENQSHATKYPMKRKYYADVLKFLDDECDPKEPVIVMGDVNVAPLDLDIGIGEPNRKRWLKDGKASFLPEEREWLQRITDWGMIDTFRHLYPEVNDMFSWFDYRSKGFDREPKRGLRIDQIMGTAPLREKLIDAGMDYDIRGMDKPSDHCPIWSEFDVNFANH